MLIASNQTSIPPAQTAAPTVLERSADSSPIPTGIYGEGGLNLPIFPYGRVGWSWYLSTRREWLMDIAVQGSRKPAYGSLALSPRRSWDRWTLGPELIAGYCFWADP